MALPTGVDTAMTVGSMDATVEPPWKDLRCVIEVSTHSTAGGD